MVNITDQVRLEVEDGIGFLVIDNPPVNALGQGVRQGLAEGIGVANESDAVAAIVIIGAGRSFPAGADIREFGKPPVPPLLPEVCQAIEDSAKPVIAALHGTALGGGFEIALSAHYRVADAGAKVGLPEINLGLLPGASGTQRMPRLTGAGPALELMLSGKPIGAGAAREIGAIDDIATGDLRKFAAAYARRLVKNGWGPRRTSDRREGLEDTVAYKKAINDARARLESTARGQIAPGMIVDCVEAALTLPFEEGMKKERACFMEALASDQSKGMIHAFFAERQSAKIPEASGAEPRALESVGVIGGGTMGAGIATAALLSGLAVTMLEMSPQAAEAAKGRIEGNLGGALKRGKISQEQFEALTTRALTLATDYDALKDADLVVEAVFEEMDVKKQVFTRLDAVCKPGAVLATNTSYLDVNEIAAATSRPSDVIGLHFFSPAHVMKLLEVVVADKTAPDVVATGFALGKRLGKISVRAGVCDGFIGNRILSTYRACADHMILDGASPYQIDKALTDFGFAMGPYAVADLAGLDIGWAVRKRLAATRDPRERVANYPDRLCEAGHFGQKTGKGYYIYEPGKRGGVPNPDVLKYIDEERAELGITPRDFSDEEIVRRYMAAMVNDAAPGVGAIIARRPLPVAEHTGARV